jgi:two-component system CheB/CheR fusion protein
VVPLREKQPRSSQQATREVLQFAQRTFGESIEERAAINEEAVPDNEEFQSTNEGLLISKEDLQSLNEGLSALNSQLKEALKRQCTTSDDLQNILNSSNIALLFLDPELKIRYFTPAARSLLNVIPGDIGCPLEDLRSLAADSELAADAQIVLHEGVSMERELETPDGL